jgi:hypothetical protein
MQTVGAEVGNRCNLMTHYLSQPGKILVDLVGLASLLLEGKATRLISGRR